jgi:hypothetical protein
VSGIFLQYWDKRGGLMQQGLPISNVVRETSVLNGKAYTMQYFERAVFEYHPENKPPFDILLSQLGTFQLKQKYPNGAPNQAANRTNGQYFAETNHWVGGSFLTYWKEHGGLAQQGYPLTEEFQERSDLDGKIYTVQYFERAVFELHPEYAGTPYEILLSQLGTFRFREKYPNSVIAQPAPGEVGAAAGQIAFELLGQVDQKGGDFVAYGYLSHINGVPDGQMFTSPDTHSEATARFTFSAPAKLTARSVISSVFVLNAAGTINIYFNDTPRGDFSDPASFGKGTPIASFSVRYQSILNVQSPNRGIETLTGELAEHTVSTFSLGGQQYRLGRPGLMQRLDFTGEGVRTDPVLPAATIFGAGATTVTGQGAP